MSIPKEEDSIALKTIVKSSLKSWKLFLFCIAFFSVFFYVYYGILKKEFSVNAFITLNSDSELETKFGKFKPRMITINNLEKIIDEPSFMSDKYKGKYFIETSTLDNSTLILSLTSSDSNVYIKLNELIDKLTNQIDNYFKHEMRSFFTNDIQNNLMKLEQESKIIENQIAGLKEIESTISLTNYSKDNIQKIKNLGLSIDLLDVISTEKEKYDQFLFSLKQEKIEKEVYTDVLKSQLEELSSKNEALNYSIYTNQIISVLYPSHEGEFVKVDLRKKIVLGAILGIIVAFFVVFFKALRRTSL